jgi:diaminopimelate epimerase
MTRFFKLSGSGNDFIALAEPPGQPTARQIAAWCRRGVSEGADGVFLVDRAGDGVRMRHFNSDGGAAALCINGTRCAARLAFELGWATGSVDVVTGAGRFTARAAGDEEVALELPAPGAVPRRVALEHEGRSWNGAFLAVGVPHLVLWWDGPLAAAPVATLGAALRRHPELGPEGANVDFVVAPTPHAIEIRSFERGVEAETLACGTGVLAATAVGLAAATLALPVEALTRGGFRLRVEAAPREGHWSMTGDARLIAEGMLRGGAEA